MDETCAGNPATPLVTHWESVMPRETKRARLLLSPRQKSALEHLIIEGQNQDNAALRAMVLLLYAEQTPISHIKNLVDLSRPTIYKYIDKALAEGVDTSFPQFYDYL